MNFKRLEYLDLKIAGLRKTKVNLQNNIKINCNIEHLDNQYKHIPHTSNSQQNFIVDLIINLGQSLEENIDKTNKNITDLASFFENSKINTLRKNLDYIKELIGDFNNTIKRFPSKKEILELTNLIEQKTPKPVELEIKSLVTSLSLEIENIKQTQQELRSQIKRLTE